MFRHIWTVRKLRYIFHFTLLTAFWISVLADVVFMIATGVKVFILSRSTNLTNHSTLEKEKKRYFDYLQLYLIMLVTWPLKIFVGFDPYGNLASEIILEIIKCFSAFLIGAIFLSKKNVRILLFDRYGILMNNAEV
jgi:uncharacterized membrane protein